MINKDRKSKKQFRKQKEKWQKQQKNQQDKLPLLKDNWNVPDL